MRAMRGRSAGVAALNPAQAGSSKDTSTSTAQIAREYANAVEIFIIIADVAPLFDVGVVLLQSVGSVSIGAAGAVLHCG